MQNNIIDRFFDVYYLNIYIYIYYLLYLPLNDLTQFSQHWEMWKNLNENNK